MALLQYATREHKATEIVKNLDKKGIEWSIELIENLIVEANRIITQGLWVDLDILPHQVEEKAVKLKANLVIFKEALELKSKEPFQSVGRVEVCLN